MSVLASLQPVLDEQTNNFINSTLNNRTFNLLPDMIRRYDNLVSLLSVEEAIKVISATELTAEQRKEVELALDDRLSGAKYSVQYEIDPEIMGGLQVYFGNSFLDGSLANRLNRVSNEVESMTG